jgi:NADPH:quinone reductase
MRALQFKAFGDPAAQLALVDLPDPQPRSGWAVVRVHAASVNPSDVKNVAGQMEGTVLPRVPGRDFSGVVEAGPSDWVGTGVWGTGGDVGFTRDGSHAGLIAVPESALARRPAALDQAQAASVGVAFVVSWMGLADYGGLQKGMLPSSACRAGSGARWRNSPTRSVLGESSASIDVRRPVARPLPPELMPTSLLMGM